MKATDDTPEGGGDSGYGVGVGGNQTPPPPRPKLTPDTPPNDTNPSLPLMPDAASGPTASSVMQTIADLISQGLQSGGVAASSPTVVPVQGGNSMLPVVLLLGAGGVAIWYFTKKHKAAA